MKTVIMAGGRGTRISELFPNIPKPLIPIDGVPVLEREIISLRDQGFKDVILTVGYLADKIKDYFGDGQKLGINIEYFVEDKPLGNAGALFKLKDKLTEDFLLLNGDVMFDIDFNRFVEYHKEHNAVVTLFTHPNSHPYDSGLIVSDNEHRVIEWLSKEDNRPKYYKNRVNAGLHVINPIILNQEIDTEKIDLDRQLLKPLCNTGKMYCYDSPEYVKDMGTPDRYKSVSKDFKEGVINSKNLINKQKAIFLDRDGTINKYVGFLTNIDDFELIDGVAEAIKMINESGYLAIVVTNQPVIARGEVSLDELQEIHNKMETLLGEKGAYLDAIYYCPHHPNKGYEGERIEYKIDCDCRKPKPGMLLKAAEDFNIDLSKSWMIGDGENDILAGKNAGCKTALIGKEEYGEDIKKASLLENVGVIFHKIWNKDDFENYCKRILVEYDSRFVNLQKSESPDFENEDIGVEITRAIGKYGNIYSYWNRYYGKEYDKENKELKSIGFVKEPILIDKRNVLYVQNNNKSESLYYKLNENNKLSLFSYSNIKSQEDICNNIKKSLISKIEKLNKNYKYKKENDLVILLENEQMDYLAGKEEIIKHTAENICLMINDVCNEYKDKQLFNKVFIIFVDTMIVIDCLNKKYEICYLDDKMNG